MISHRAKGRAHSVKKRLTFHSIQNAMLRAPCTMPYPAENKTDQDRAKKAHLRYKTNGFRQYWVYNLAAVQNREASDTLPPGC